MKYRTQAEERITEMISSQYDFSEPCYPNEMSYATRDFEHKIASELEDLSDDELIDMFYQSTLGYMFEEFEADIEYELMHEMTTCVITRADRNLLGKVNEQASLTENMSWVLDVYYRSLWTPAQIEAANPPEVFEAEHVIELALEVLHDTMPKESNYDNM